MTGVGEAVTLWTVRGAFACYVASVSVRSRTGSRWWWTAGFVLFAAHVAAAFHYYHGWSHRAAWIDTERRTAEVMGSGWGGGLWFNYVFAVAWAAEVWRLWRESDWGRRWTVFLHGFFVFLFFNATVVFGRGAIQWVGLTAFLWLAWVWWRRR